jgi:5-methylthioadenosine/S-adenosylhomocysteine deaminase
MNGRVLLSGRWIFLVILLISPQVLIAGGASGPSAATASIDLLLIGGAVVTIDAQQRIFDPGYVAIKGQRIAGVGPMSELARVRWRARRTINLPGRVIMPGLINTHTHLAMTMLRGIGDDLNLNDWLNQYIFPAESENVTRPYVAAGTRLGLVELIRGGVTTYADMYYFEDTVAQETWRAGVRGVLGETLLDFPAPDNKTWPEAIRYGEWFVKRWKGDSLIIPALAPHAIYTVNRSHLEEVRQLAERLDVPIMTHLAEAKTETEFARQNFNLSPTAYLEMVGLLSPRTLLAHVVHADQEDLQMLYQHGVGIAHCPQSNMKLASGTAPIPAMLAKGMRVGLGTDGAASNNDLNLWEEIDTAAKLHKLISADPTVVSAREALTMATIGGARALHLEEKIGSLETGKLADLIVVRMNAPHQTPVYNLQSHLVYATKSGDVSDVMVNGRWLMRQRKLLTIDDQKAMTDVRAFQRQIRQSLKPVLMPPPRQ